MKKIIKILLFVLLTVSIFSIKNTSLAAIDLNIGSNSTSSTASNTTSNSTSTQNLQNQYGDELDNGGTSTSSSSTSTSTSTSTSSDSSAAEVYSLSALPESSLGLSNILNILLISVGIILILFGIAILIKLKQ